jgi:SAM-dependent methyltransferase
MAKANEIAYIAEVARQNIMPLGDFQTYLLNKPFSDPRCYEYLMDVAQIMSFLPAAPSKVLDVGVGSGWTSEVFSKAGYSVTGIDISADMIDIAKRRNCSAVFRVADYETAAIDGKFDAAVIYDALHHADDASLVIRNIYNALAPGGVLVTIEPGRGHSTSEYSLEATRQFGTTEQDMPYKLQAQYMKAAGFSQVRQHPRAIVPAPKTLIGFLYQRARLLLGDSSVVVAKKKQNVRVARSVGWP